MNARAAALAVADRARNADDCRDLLDALGLLAELAPKRTRPLVHGVSGYKKGCRCDVCRTKHSAHWRAWYEEAKIDPSRADRAGHGKASTYKNYGCRCAACSSANTDNVNAYRARRKARQLVGGVA